MGQDNWLKCGNDGVFVDKCAKSEVKYKRANQRGV